MRGATDHLLVEAALLGDRAAFESILERYQELVYGLAFDLLSDPDEAESVVQDTFVTAWRKLDYVAREVSDLRLWLLKVAENHGRNSARRLGKRVYALDLAQYELEPSEADELDTRWQYSELLAQIMREVQQMGSEDERIVRRLLIEGASYEVVAHELALSVGAVKMRLTRIRKRLRKNFGEEW